MADNKSQVILPNETPEYIQDGEKVKAAVANRPNIDIQENVQTVRDRVEVDIDNLNSLLGVYARDYQSQTYNVGDIVKATDGNLYVSLINNNTDEPPSSNWIKFEDLSPLFVKAIGDTIADGDILTRGQIEAGYENGGVALTVQDGYGAANVTFNHRNGKAEIDGSSGRITVNISDTTPLMKFQLKDNVSSGDTVNLEDVIIVSKDNGLETVNNIKINAVSDSDDIQIYLRDESGVNKAIVYFCRADSKVKIGLYDSSNNLQVIEELSLNDVTLHKKLNVAVTDENAITAGVESGENIQIGTNVIKAQNNGAVSNLLLNPNGGLVEVNTNITNSNGDIQKTTIHENELHLDFEDSGGDNTKSRRLLLDVENDGSKAKIDWRDFDNNVKTAINMNDTNISLSASRVIVNGPETVNGTITVNVNTGTRILDWATSGSPGYLRRITDQGGLFVKSDSSLVIHAGDQEDVSKLGISSGTQDENLWLTADNHVRVRSGTQNGFDNGFKQWTFAADGNLYCEQGNIVIHDTNTQIQEGGGNSVRVRTNSGYVDIGPQNSSWCHFQTDRSQFYFNNLIRAVGSIGVYGYNTYLEGTKGYINGHEIYHTGNITNTYDAAHVFSTNGYIKFTNGLIFQWVYSGYISLNQSTHTINFPATFPNNVFHVNAGIRYGSAVSGTVSAVVKSFNTSSVTVFGDHSDSAPSGYIYVWAVGN